MNINFGMDNFYVRYLKRFLASEMPQTNMVLGEFDKDDQQLLIQYLNLPNVEPMSRVQKELNKRFPQLKSMFFMDLQDNIITLTAKTISNETSQFISENLDEIQEYCKSVGWKLVDATEWIDTLMDINNDGVIDDKDKLIVQDIAYNNNGYEIPKGRIQGKLVDTNIINWTALEPTITLYNSYNQVVSQSNLETIGHTYLFRDLEQGTYHITISAKGFLDITMNNIYVKTGFLSHVQDIRLLAGEVNGDNIIDEKDQNEIQTYIGQPISSDTIKYDLNRDGIIDNTDVDISKSNKGKVPANLYWVENMEEMETRNKYPADIRERADIDKDGAVDGSDVSRITNYLLNGKPYIKIIMENRKNHFPNNDMKVFVNQFDGTFLYDYAIKDGLGYDGFPHKNASGMYKIALYKCKPNQKITIAHNNTKNTRLVIGSSPVRLKQDVTGSMLQNVVDITLNSGESYEYQAGGSETGTYNAYWVCIQCPSSHGDLLGTSAKSITGEIGDINFDGKIDMEDYKLAAYYTAEGSSMATDLHWKATPRQILAMDVNKDGKVTTEDAVAIHNFINGTFPRN